MSKKTVAFTTAGFLILFAALGIYLAKQDVPRNKNGYIYKEHFVHAGEADSMGVLSFDIARIDTTRIYTVGDTLVIDFPGDRPDDRRYAPGMPPMDEKMITKIVTGRMIMLNMQPLQFYSIYLFPDSTWEVWSGTQPGKTTAYVGSERRKTFIASDDSLDVSYRAEAAYDTLGNPRHYVWGFGEPPDSSFLVAPTNLCGYIGNVVIALQVDRATGYRSGSVRLLIARGDPLPVPPPPPFRQRR